MPSSQISNIIRSKFTQEGYLEEKFNGNYITDCNIERNHP
nr:MAG TPA: hypothetical protein [Caudoviricetes sp.]